MSDIVEEIMADMTLSRLFYFVGLAVRTRKAHNSGALKYCGCSLCR